MVKIVVVIVIFLLYCLSMHFVTKTINRLGTKKSVPPYRIKYIVKTLNIALSAFFIAALFLVLGIQYSQLSVLLSSVFAVLGVALFAQWSILSNITASLIIFFSFPYRVGDWVRVVDKDADIYGIVEGITLFHVLIRQGNELITYPNNLILQKAVIKMPGPMTIKTVESETASG